MENCVAKIIPLPNNDTLSFLKAYNSFLKSLFARKLKSFTTMGGYSEIVSADSLARIELRDEICVMINVMIAKLPCHSVYSGIIMSHLLIKLWSEFYQDYSIHEILSSVNKMRALLTTALDSMKIEKTDINLNFLRSVVVFIFTEEKSLCLGESSLKDLSLEVVKSVLSVAGADGSRAFGEIGVHVEHGADRFFTVNGILCEVDDSNAKLVESDFFKNPTTLKIILFSEYLDVPDANLFVSEIVKGNVRAIFCQKGISDALRVMLRRERVLLVERGGEEKMRGVHQMTGGFVITDLSDFPLTDFPSMAGHFSKISLVYNASKNLVSIENTGSCMVSLYVSCRSFTEDVLIKKVIYKCILSLKSALSNPHYLPGPVVFEESLSSLLQTRQEQSPLIQGIVAVLVNSLRELAALYKETRLMDKCDYCLDSFELKRNAVLQAVDGVNNILSLSHILRK